MKTLLIGDVFGETGRRAVRKHLPELVRSHEVEFVVANAENAAGGLGITAEVVEHMFRSGVHCLTGGNHTWDKKDAEALLEKDPRILRPCNYPPPCPGSGVFVGQAASGVPVAVINVMGRIFMNAIDDPFRSIDQVLARLDDQIKVILVDVHAEATSEKAAMGRYLDGRVTAVLGTHTHVQTADARLLENGTAFITDVGMTGPYDSIIGMDKEPVLERFLTGRPSRFRPAREEPGLRAVIVEADLATGRARSIERIALGAGGR